MSWDSTRIFEFRKKFGEFGLQHGSFPVRLMALQLGRMGEMRFGGLVVVAISGVSGGFAWTFQGALMRCRAPFGTLPFCGVRAQLAWNSVLKPGFRVFTCIYSTAAPKKIEE